MNTRRIDAPIVVRSSSIGLGAALRERARAGVERAAAKYFCRLNAATVYFSRDGRGYRCTVNIDMGAMRIVTGESLGFCCYTVFDAAMRKAAKQLRRLKRTLRDDKAPRAGWMPGDPPERRWSRARRPRRAGAAPQGDALALADIRGLGPDGWRKAEGWLDEPACGTGDWDRPDAASSEAASSAPMPHKTGEAGSAHPGRRTVFAHEAQAGTPGERR